MQETQEMWVQSLGGEDPLDKEVATHSGVLAWRIPWTEEPGGLPSIGLQGWDTSRRLTHHRAKEGRPRLRRACTPSPHLVVAFYICSREKSLPLVFGSFSWTVNLERVVTLLCPWRRWVQGFPTLLAWPHPSDLLFLSICYGKSKIYFSWNGNPLHTGVPGIAKSQTWLRD